MRVAITLGRGLSLNAVSVLPAVPIVRRYLYLPAAEWWWTGHRPLWMLVGEAVAALALIDLPMTLVHVWWHGPLARLHAGGVHHAVPEDRIDWHVGQAFGPWEPLMGVLVVWASLSLWGISLGPALAATSTMLAFALWAHTPPRPWHRLVERVLVTPRSHRVHHSPDPALYDKNCAFVLSFWDRLLGTWRDPA